MLLHEDRLFPAEPKVRSIAKALYAHVKTFPIVSPHGHTQAAWFAKNEPFPDPAKLFVQPDHYVYRMLYSQGVSLEDLEIGEPLDFLSAGAYTASYAAVEFNGFAPIRTYCI